MEKKINIAELLKDCPKGMELDCTICNNVVTLYGVDKEGYYPINVATKDGFHHTLTCEGYVFDEGDAKCVIFPKGKTTWEGFTPPCKFKDGDIVTCTNNACTYTAIFKEMIGKGAFCHYGVLVDNKFRCRVNDWSDFNETCRLATEEEKQKLFDAIKEHGYKWNEETKTLEELIESKEDTDRIVMSGIYFDRENYADEVELCLNNYEIEIRDGKTYAVFKNQKNKTLKKLPKFKVGDRIIKRDSIVNSWIVSSVSSEYYGLQLPSSDGIGVLPIVEQDDYELVSDIEPKFKKGDRIKHKENTGWVCTIRRVEDRYYVDGHPTCFIIPFDKQDEYELVSNKFDITTLKPFESKVLVRDTNKDKWKPSFWGFYDIDYAMNYPYECCGNSFAQCIPYEGNEHLCGKTNDCNDFYKTWK